jgi:hypothetical protein
MRFFLCFKRVSNTPSRVMPLFLCFKRVSNTPSRVMPLFLCFKRVSNMRFCIHACVSTQHVKSVGFMLFECFQHQDSRPCLSDVHVDIYMGKYSKKLSIIHSLLSLDKRRHSVTTKVCFPILRQRNAIAAKVYI